LRKGHGIGAPACGRQGDFAASTQAVDSEKDLVPRQVSASACDVFKVAGLDFSEEIDHMILDDRMLCHAPPLGNEMSCCENSIASSVPQVGFV
jgi:hypothetical protein